jgi:hypothetical protein
MLMLVLVVPFSNQSCTNLEEEVFDRLTEDNFPRTSEEFIAALGAAYTSLYGFAGHNGYFSLQEVSSDEVLIPQRGGDWFDGGQWLRVHRHEYNAQEESINTGWNFLFGGVANCNRLIELFEGLVAEGSVAQAEADGFIAELKVLRALYYFWLMDAYGSVPIVTAFASADAAPANKERAEVYAFIESELNANVPKLDRAKNSATYARINYWTGKAIQAKLYLNAEVYTGTAKWAEAGAAADEIINSGLYSLESDYFDNFSAENDGSSENIYVIPYDEVNARGFNLAQMTLHYSSQASFNLQQQPWNGYCAVTEFYNKYEAGDLRRNGPAARGYGNFLAGPQFNADGTRAEDSGAETADPDGKPLTFTPEINEHFPNCLRQAGARIGKFEYEDGATPDLNNDFPLFRYADILLTKAEVLHRQGQSGQGLILVNQIRNRAGVASLAALTDQDLLDERGREMFYEGWRRQDLIRFGKYSDIRQFKPTVTPAFRNVFPIPQNQINANPSLNQNPGYN